MKSYKNAQLVQKNAEKKEKQRKMLQNTNIKIVDLNVRILIVILNI